MIKESRIGKGINKVFGPTFITTGQSTQSSRIRKLSRDEIKKICVLGGE